MLLDIEEGTGANYDVFAQELLWLYSTNTEKRYRNSILYLTISENELYRFYMTAAPQCPFPDALMGEAISNAFFDAVYVQFCKRVIASFCTKALKSSSDNNYCGLDKYYEANVSRFFLFVTSY